MIQGIFAQQAMTAPVTSSSLEFVGSKTIRTGNTGVVPFDFSGLTGGVNSSPSVGDYFLLIASVSAGDPTISVPSFTGMTGQIFWRSRGSITGRDGRLEVFEGVYEAGSAAGGSFDISINADVIFTILVFRNCSGWRTWASNSYLGTDNAPPDRTPSTTGDWVVAIASAHHQAGWHTLTPPSGVGYQITESHAWNGGYDVSQTIAIKQDPVIGSAFDPGFFEHTANVSTGSGVAIGGTIVLGQA